MPIVVDGPHEFYFNLSSIWAGFILINGKVQDCNFNLSSIWASFIQIKGKVQDCNFNFDNGVCHGAISILKWDKILVIVMGFTNALFGQ